MDFLSKAHFASIIASQVSLILALFVWWNNRGNKQMPIWFACSLFMAIGCNIVLDYTYWGDFTLMIAATLYATSLRKLEGITVKYIHWEYLLAVFYLPTAICLHQNFHPVYALVVLPNAAASLYSLIALGILRRRRNRLTAREDSSDATLLTIAIFSFTLLLYPSRVLSLFISQSGLLDFYISAEELLNFSQIIAGLILYILVIVFSHTSFFLLFEEQKNKLDKTNQALEANGAVLSRCLSVVSHELRTPLNGVMGLAQTMLDNPTKDHKKKLKTIIDTGSYVAQLSNQFLEYAKLQQQQQQQQQPTAQKSSSVDIHTRSHFNEIFDVLSGQQPSSNIFSFRLDFQDEIPEYISIDKVKLNSVLFNLVENAFKYTQKGEVLLKVFLVDDLQYLRCEIYDQGESLKIEQIEKLCQPFTRSEGSNNLSGSGLGLFITSNLLIAMKSQLQYRANTPQGVIFYFDIPFSLAKAKNLLQNNECDELETIRILLVEDIDLNIDVVLAMLSHERYNITTAKTARDAKLNLETQSFDVILLDIQLPDDSGLSLYHHIKTQPFHHDTRIIVLTASVTGEDINTYSSLNIHGVVEKPILKRNLIEIIHNSGSPDVKILEHEVFNTELFDFLYHNVEQHQFFNVYNTLDTTFAAEVNTLRAYIENNDKVAYSKQCHQMASYYGQWGLILVKLFLKNMQEHAEFFNHTVLVELEQSYQIGRKAMTTYHQKKQ